MVELNLKIPAIEKLVDYCASGIGAIGGPMLSRWTAQRRADAQRIEAQGQADVTRLIADAQAEARSLLPAGHSSSRGELAIGKEIKSRLEFQEKKRQSNIKSVVSMAAEEIRDKEVADHEVDHDWTARFFADAQDATSEHMQKIWAKILAGEVETPGRTSLHTLAILKNMTQRDAKLFEGQPQRFGGLSGKRSIAAVCTQQSVRQEFDELDCRHDTARSSPSSEPRPSTGGCERACLPTTAGRGQQT